jgi:cytochrome c biogenesis protein CcmG/thiol:disulfide interchange protein DsbE
MKRFLPLIIFGVIVLAFAIGLTKDPRRMEDMLIDQPFPEFELTALDRPEQVLNENVIKGEVSLVNVFGSWCVSCNVEHPILMEISQDEAIRMVGHNWRDGRENARKWLNDKGDPYDIIIYDEHSELAIPLGVTGAPETFITDKQGRIRYKHSGPIGYQDWEETLRPLIQTLKAE